MSIAVEVGQEDITQAKTPGETGARDFGDIAAYLDLQGEVGVGLRATVEKAPQAPRNLNIVIGQAASDVLDEISEQVAAFFLPIVTVNSPKIDETRGKYVPAPLDEVCSESIVSAVKRLASRVITRGAESRGELDEIAARALDGFFTTLAHSEGAFREWSSELTDKVALLELMLARVRWRTAPPASFRILAPEQHPSSP